MYFYEGLCYNIEQGDWIMVETVKTTLNENQNISEEVKVGLMELIEIFNKMFPDVNLNNLNEKLKTLIIRRESMFLLKLPCQYNSHNNEIVINLGRFEESDARHWMMHALLGVITSQNNYYGFNNDDDRLLALNEGYTEIITNYLVGDMEDNFYFDEIIVTNLLNDIVKENVLYDAYFNNDANKVIEMIDKESVLSDVNDILNAYYKMNVQVGNDKQTSLKQIKTMMSEKWNGLCARWIPIYAEECPSTEKCYYDEFTSFYNNTEKKEVNASVNFVDNSKEVETLEIVPQKKL